MNAVHPAILWVGGGGALFATTASITTVLLQFQSPSRVAILAETAQSQVERTCQTITTDPQPPLNVRSSPVVAPDNIVAGLKNGTPLTVVDSNEGWLRISAPVQGWVYQQLTVTTCTNTPGTVAALMRADPAEQDTRILSEATELYHLGNLTAAIALAETIPLDSWAYASAKESLQHWHQDWQRAENQYYIAQKAFREGRWQDVLRQVEGFPENRFWRQKLTPLVKVAIEQQRSPQTVRREGWSS